MEHPRQQWPMKVKLRENKKATYPVMNVQVLKSVKRGSLMICVTCCAVDPDSCIKLLKIDRNSRATIVRVQLQNDGTWIGFDVAIVVNTVISTILIVRHLELNICEST